MWYPTLPKTQVNAAALLGGGPELISRPKADLIAALARLLIDLFKVPSGEAPAPWRLPLAHLARPSPWWGLPLNCSLTNGLWISPLPLVRLRPFFQLEIPNPLSGGPLCTQVASKRAALASALIRGHPC